MHRLFLLLSICAVAGCSPNDNSQIIETPVPNSAKVSDVGTLSVGDSQNSFDALVSLLCAEELTPGMAMIEPGGQNPIQVVIWEFSDFGAVVAVSFDDGGSLAHLEYCSVDDFGMSKLHRSDSTVDLSSITFRIDRTTSRVAASTD